jgi:hypothetical protein
MRRIYALLSLSVALAPAIALAQTTNDPAAPASRPPLAASGEVADPGAVPDTAAQQEKKICRTERITGSLTRRSRICLTEREWARMAEGTRRNQDALDRDGNQTFAANPNAAIQGAINGPALGGGGS